MLEQQGMEESEARTAVEDIDKAMGNKQAVFTKKEALKILPKLVQELQGQIKEVIIKTNSVAITKKGS